MGVVATERAARKGQLCMNCDKTHDSMIGRETVSSSDYLYQHTEIAMAPSRMSNILAVSSAHASGQQSRSNKDVA